METMHLWFLKHTGKPIKGTVQSWAQTEHPRKFTKNQAAVGILHAEVVKPKIRKGLYLTSKHWPRRDASEPFFIMLRWDVFLCKRSEVP